MQQEQKHGNYSEAFKKLKEKDMIAAIEPEEFDEQDTDEEKYVKAKVKSLGREAALFSVPLKLTRILFSL